MFVDPNCILLSAKDFKYTLRLNKMHEKCNEKLWEIRRRVFWQGGTSKITQWVEIISAGATLARFKKDTGCNQNFNLKIQDENEGISKCS